MSSLISDPRSLNPIIILVRPQMGENIGAVARAMSNFGLSELRLAAPRDGWPNPKAVEMAAGAESIIHNAKVFADFNAALADVQVAYATTARSRHMEKRVVEPDMALEEIREFLSAPPPTSNLPPPGVKAFRKAALVFGPERSGLENDEVNLCDTLITIPTAPENSSLNIAQSMVIIGYEWFRTRNESQAVMKELPDIAPRGEWQGLCDQLESYLDAADYFRVAGKKPVMWRNLQNMLLRAQWSSQEVRTFRGVLRSLWERNS